MKIKKILIILLFILTIILTPVTVNGAGTKIEASSNNVNVGEEVKINVSFTAAAWNLTISGDNITEASYASHTQDLSEETTTKSIVLDTSKAGTYTIKLLGDITDENGKTTKVNESVTVKVTEPVKEPEPIKPEKPTEPEKPTTPDKPDSTTEPEKPTTPEPKPEQGEQKKSNDATLKMLGIGSSAKNPSKYDFSGFQSGKLNYSITVPNNVEGLEVYYTVNDNKAKCEISGNTGFEVGKNTINAKVTAEDGTEKTYTITVTREEEKSGDATLSNLGIGKSANEASEYDFSGFQKDVYEYSIEVPYEVTSLDVYYKLSKSTSIADVSGSSNFNVGENAIKVLVTAEDGTQKTYTINVTRLEKNAVTSNPENNEQEGNSQGNDVSDDTQEPIQTTLQLETLELSKGKLSPNFDGSITQYSVTVGNRVDSIEINAIPNQENTTIEIAGNENLQEGENIITILVRSADDSEIVTYQIKVTKTNQMDIIGFITDKENQNIMIILGVILIFIIIIIILLIKESKEDDEEEKVKPKKGKAKRFKEDEQEIEEIKEEENINNN